MSEPIFNTPEARYIDYDTLNFIPIEEKNEEWAAETLAYVKANSQQFVTDRDVKKYRMLENGEIDEQAYKEIIDPMDEEGNGGSAEYFSADWKSNPIFNHLNTLIEAGLEKIPINLYVKAADEFAQLKLQKENARIIGRKEMEQWVNQMNKKLGFPPIKPGSDPFKYAKSMQGQVEAPVKGTKSTSVGDIPVNIMDSLKAVIEDDEDLALFNEYIWKDGVEIGTEIGIKHYMGEVNRFARTGEKLIKDIKNHNKAACWWYTSTTTGLPVIDYMEPHLLWISRYKKYDGSDATHWYTELEVTYGEFVRMFGSKLSADQLRAAFKLNRENHGVDDDWEKLSPMRRNTARMRIGYMEWESQDMEVYSEYKVNGNSYFKQVPTDYQPSETYVNKKGENPVRDWNATRKERHYNVWYKCYYIPLAGSAINAAAVDFEKQAQYIYGFGKVQDQQREGDDFKYCKNSLVIWSSPALSFGEIMARYMGKVNLLWFQFQNDLANVIPHGAIFYKEFMELALTSQDEATDGKDATTKFVKKLKQTGNQVGKLFTAGGELNPTQFRPYDEVHTGHLASAMEKLNAMAQIYEMMKAALGISDAREGKDPAPRTPSSGIKIALQASTDSTFYVEKGYTNIIVELGTRLMYYINCVINEGDDSERLQDLVDVIGKANGMALESIREIPMHKLGLGVSNVITDDQKAKLQNMVDQMAGAGMIDIDIAMFLETVDNLKYAYAIVRLYLKKKQKETQAQQEAQAQQAMQLKQMDVQISMAEIQAKAQGQLQFVELSKKLDGWLLELETKLKTEGQIAVKNTIKDNRIEENMADVQIQKQLDADIPDQNVTIPSVT